MKRSLLLVASLLALSSVAVIGCEPPQPSDFGDDDGDEHDGTDVGMEEGSEGINDTDTGTTSSALSRKAKVSKGACPTKARTSQGFSGKHDGIDLANAKGTPIYAVAAGSVVTSGTASGYGQWIRIKHDDGSMTEYGHMYSRLVSAGTRVSAGQKIALMGSEGRSTGPHLHLRTYRSAGSTGAGRGMNPVDYLRARGVTLPCTPGGVVTAASASADEDDATSSESASTVSVWKDANLMSTASTSGSFIVQANEDTTYPALCWKQGEMVASDGYTNDKWVKIMVGSQTGFISGIFLRGDKTGGVSTQCQ